MIMMKWIIEGVIILVVLKIALIAFSLLNIGGVGDQIFAGRSFKYPNGLYHQTKIHEYENEKLLEYLEKIIDDE